ncbi:FkbM family methyltransferase [Pantoea sp. FN0305]|uniref:FkbM family methyltransferase n=1 Tax=Pantoea sp. FN0305 TaxID=3418559 RepID=UPI003CEBC7A1
MRFLDLIVEQRNHFLTTTTRMQTNGHPIVLIGAGCLAQMTCSFMQREALRIDHIAVNQQYLTAGATFNEFELEALEHFIQSGQPCNYIIALQFVSDEFIAQLSSHAAEILIYDPSFIGVNTDSFITREYCQQHESEFDALYQQLADDKSRQTLVAFLNQRICAEPKYYQTVFDPDHYFPTDIISLGSDEVFVDCGAYNGDSIAAFLAAIEKRSLPQPHKIYGFEPDSGNFAKLSAATASLGYCHCYNKGVWSSTTTLHFDSGRALSSKISDDESMASIDLITIDEVTAGEKVTFIKMDIEGAELEALKGASSSIQSHRPVLAISAYHKPEDLLTLPHYIQSLVPEYRFYLRAHHSLHAFELVLYAIAD